MFIEVMVYVASLVSCYSQKQELPEAQMRNGLEENSTTPPFQPSQPAIH